MCAGPVCQRSNVDHKYQSNHPEHVVRARRHPQPPNIRFRVCCRLSRVKTADLDLLHTTIPFQSSVLLNIVDIADANYITITVIR